MGYCIDDICHNAGPICGAGSPYHCRADGGPPADHYCDDPGCETCMPWDDDDYPGEPIQPGDEHYYRLPAEEPEGPQPERVQLKVDLYDAAAGVYDVVEWNDRFPVILSPEDEESRIQLPDALWEWPTGAPEETP